jgi:predicted nuclease with RNAse H fold
MHFGIDYGSKLAGTTVITYNIGKTLVQLSSRKKEDADVMILQAAEKMEPSAIYIDAPLSLPNAYYGKGENYFYRKSDLELKAMSPMFLGGLTARAMQLKATLKGINTVIFETYPAALVRSIPELKEKYSRKDGAAIAKTLDQMEILMPDFQLIKRPINMHQVDSVLAWYSGYRHQKGSSTEVGDRDEGVIIY